MARKPWGDLSPGYRAKLERQGQTAETHGLTYQQLIDKFSPDFEAMYGRVSRDNPRPGRPWNAPDIKDVLKNMSSKEGRKYMKEQLSAQRYYDRGELAKAQKRWQQRDRSKPEWMYFYHGAFSGE